jgi:hypothetical protein
LTYPFFLFVFTVEALRVLLNIAVRRAVLDVAKFRTVSGFFARPSSLQPSCSTGTTAAAGVSNVVVQTNE